MTEDTPQPTGRRGMGGWPDMVRSMGLIVAISLVLSAFALRAPDRDPVQAVDLPAIAVGASKQAGFALIVPTLDPAWRPTSARLVPATDDISKSVWHIGYVSPEGAYHAVEQSDTVLADRFVSEWTSGLEEAADQVEVAGISWRVFFGTDGQAVYVSKASDSIVCVVTTTEPEGQTLVRSVATELGH